MSSLSKTFRSVKPSNPTASKPPLPSSSTSSKAAPWCVYLILSSAAPIKTYVGVTNNFPRRLKQHNGELRGGAKASRGGRPWICACLIGGFNDKSEACVFESKWKNISRKLPRRQKNDEKTSEVDEASKLLLQHRLAALNKVKGSIDCTCLEIDWQWCKNRIPKLEAEDFFPVVKEILPIKSILIEILKPNVGPSEIYIQKFFQELSKTFSKYQLRVAL